MAKFTVILLAMVLLLLLLLLLFTEPLSYCWYNSVNQQQHQKRHHSKYYPLISLDICVLYSANTIITTTNITNKMINSATCIVQHSLKKVSSPSTRHGP